MQRRMVVTLVAILLITLVVVGLDAEASERQEMARQQSCHQRLYDALLLLQAADGLTLMEEAGMIVRVYEPSCDEVCQAQQEIERLKDRLAMQAKINAVLDDCSVGD